MGGVADGLSLGDLIRAARGRRRWTQQELADRLEVNRKTVDNWENGRTTPSLATFAAIEHVLGVSLTTDAPPPDPNEEVLMNLDLDPAEREKLVKAYRAIRDGNPGQRQRAG